MIEYIKAWLTVKNVEKGQDLAEYALLIGLIALIVVVAVTLLGTNIEAVFDRIALTVGGWAIGT